jgi:hypothetical protein
LIPPWAAVAVILFIVLAALFMNMIFARWSSICRVLERYYETIEGGQDINFDAGKHGFRHLFRSLAKGESVDKIESHKWWFPKAYFDVFVISIIIFGSIYLIAYFYIFKRVCG